MIEISCRNCRHFVPESSECRRFPPTPVVSTFLVQLPSTSTTMLPGINPVATAQLQGAVSQWPRMAPSAWCGEFRAATDS